MKTEEFILNEKTLAKLIEEYGLSDFAIINKTTGEVVQDIINGTKVKNPKLIYRNKEEKELVKFQPKELFVKLYKKAIEQNS